MAFISFLLTKQGKLYPVKDCRLVVGVRFNVTRILVQRNNKWMDYSGFALNSWSLPFGIGCNTRLYMLSVSRTQQRHVGEGCTKTFAWIARLNVPWKLDEILWPDRSISYNCFLFTDFLLSQWLPAPLPHQSLPHVYRTEHTNEPRWVPWARYTDYTHVWNEKYAYSYSIMVAGMFSTNLLTFDTRVKCFLVTDEWCDVWLYKLMWWSVVNVAMCIYSSTGLKYRSEVLLLHFAIFIFTSTPL